MAINYPKRLDSSQTEDEDDENYEGGEESLVPLQLKLKEKEC